MLDENECAQGITKYTGNAGCSNLIGGHECKCIEPYVGDGVEYCMNEADYITVANLKASIDGESVKSPLLIDYLTSSSFENYHNTIS